MIVSNIKVTHVITGLDTGGAETMLYRLLSAAPSAGSTAEVISLTDIGPVGRRIELLGIPVRALGMKRRVPSPSAFLRLVSWLRRSRPDVVQTWMYHADLLGGLAAFGAGRRNIVWNIRTAGVPRQNGLTIAAMRSCAALSRWLPKRIVCVAEAAKQTHIGYGYDATRMVVIPNGLDPREFRATPADTAVLKTSCGFTADDTVIGWVGRFHPDKGHDNLVKAAALVVASHPRAKFLLVGRNCDSGNATLGTWLDERGLGGRFVLFGERDDIPLCLSAMDVFCMPSSNEGFPNALAEAMAMGLPCVATKVGDAAIVTGDAAVMVAPRDERALARGLMDVLDLSPEERQQLGQRARTRVLENFSIARTVREFQTLYEDVLREAGR